MFSDYVNCMYGDQNVNLSRFTPFIMIHVMCLCFPSGTAVDSQGVSSANVSAQIVFIVCGCTATVLVVIAVICVAAKYKG